ncbi:hypothetical protein J4446_00190 [Candidatus Woesearchaeota archaeon]|nr:hypothetical protein [Candidatus Woesearchaeota archaeon]
MKRNYFYINKEFGDEESVKIGLNWLISICKLKKNGQALLAVIQKENLKGMIENVLNRSIINKLILNKDVILENIQLKVITEKERLYDWKGPILIAFPNKKLLDKIDSMPSVVDVLVIPYSLSEIQYWINTWNAQSFGEKRSEERQSSLSSLTKEALKMLVNSTNKGIIHPLDKAKTVDLFKKLIYSGEKINADDVRVWLVREGEWKPKNADDVRELVEKICVGKNIKTIGKSFWEDNILDQLRAKMNEV